MHSCKCENTNCSDEVAYCDFCIEKMRLAHNRPKRRDYEDLFKADDSDLFVSHNNSDEGRYYDIYNYTDKDGLNPYYVKVDQDGGESLHEGEY